MPATKAKGRAQGAARKRGQRCTVCDHASKEAIDRALVEGDSDTGVAAHFRGLSPDAVRRHRQSHLPALLAEGAAVAKRADAFDTFQQLDQCLERVNLLFGACDRWLRDPDDPTQYDIGPRAENLKVTYVERGEDGKAVRKKAALSELLARVAGEAPDVRLVETRHADPRELVLHTVKRLEGLVELFARIRGELPDTPVAILVSPAWVELRGRILCALEPYPEARRAVAAAVVGAS